MSFVKFENVYKRYIMGEITINAADGVSFEIEKGEFAVIVGASGAGKTTILNMLGGMDTCDEGKILVDGKDIATFNKKQLTTYRRYDIGFVFQFYNLVNNLTAKENVELATQICAHASQPEEVLKKVGLEDRMNNFPSQLSGGEQQRVALNMAEESQAQTFSFARALDDARNISHDKTLVIAIIYDTQRWFERSKRIVCNLRTGT